MAAHPSARKQARSTPSPAPRAHGSGSNITLPPGCASAESDHCPVCGQEVPQDRLEEHLELHRRLKVASASRRSTPRAPAQVPGLPAQSQVPQAVTAGGGGTGQTPLQIRRRAINHYGLDGVAPLSTDQLAQELAVSPQRVGETVTQTLSILRTPASRDHLESMTLTVARQNLGRRRRYAMPGEIYLIQTTSRCSPSPSSPIPKGLLDRVAGAEFAEVCPVAG